jgi:hypothetical protein
MPFRRNSYVYRHGCLRSSSSGHTHPQPRSNGIPGPVTLAVEFRCSWCLLRQHCWFMHVEASPLLPSHFYMWATFQRLHVRTMGSQSAKSAETWDLPPSTEALMSPCTCNSHLHGRWRGKTGHGLRKISPRTVALSRGACPREPTVSQSGLTIWQAEIAMRAGL